MVITGVCYGVLAEWFGRVSYRRFKMLKPVQSVLVAGRFLGIKNHQTCCQPQRDLCTETLMPAPLCSPALACESPLPLPWTFDICTRTKRCAWISQVCCFIYLQYPRHLCADSSPHLDLQAHRITHVNINRRQLLLPKTSKGERQNLRWHFGFLHICNANDVPNIPERSQPIGAAPALVCVFTLPTSPLQHSKSSRFIAAHLQVVFKRAWIWLCVVFLFIRSPVSENIPQMKITRDV